ncbi:MAG: tRNA (pseudouridine(54)-N(1))-methyltransferase TrmY [Candidatus Atribacteria bacterium]|nr:MAG: tRNA (pseudouridine(54)-N(1))-methyltransferase TrmY [Candidatus Atribacteria bacterium]
MRRFLILGHKAATEPDFTLNDLPGAAGRLDVLCRAIGASLFLSHGIRRDVEVSLLLQDSIHIRISGEYVKRLNPDERSTAALIKHALQALAEDSSDNEVRSTPGITVSRRSLSGVLDTFLEANATPIVLHEEGEPAESYSFPKNPAFILSDHTEFTESDQILLAEYPRISLGATALHTSQAITITHYLLDQQEDERSADLVLAHKVWGEPKARLIISLLEDFDIPVNRMMHAPPSIYPMVLNGMAEVRIMVRPRDLARAQQIIADYFETPVEE